MGEARRGESLDLEGQRALATVLAGLGSRPVARPRVGRYEIGESLGRGGCGQVFAAHDPKLDREVAIKVVATGRERPQQTGDRAAEARLVREGQALARLQHPNTVKVYDVGIDDLGGGVGGQARRGVYIVMERIRGRTLSRWLRETSPAPLDIIRAYLDAARGLAAAHAVGVVHRDFKPGNAMVTEDGTVLVLDFGLATALDERGTLDTHSEAPPASGSSSGSVSNASLTATGVVMGTPRYMAPEQHSARPATPATDQYAWCVALWEALSGVPPFVASSIEELAQVKRDGKLPALPRVAPHVRAALVRGLSPDPERRFESMTSLVAAIERGSGRRRARNVALFGALAAGAIAAAFSIPAPTPALCDRDGAPEPTWGAEQIATIVADLQARADPPYPILVERIRLRLERFSRGWDETFASVCDASGEASEPAVREVQAQCLERAAARWEDARRTLVSGSRKTLPWLSQLWALQNPRHCGTADAAAAFSADGQHDPELHDARATIEALLFGEGAGARLPDTDLDHVLEVADRHGDHALAANALLLRARLHSHSQEFGNATRTASLAAWRARGGDDVLLASEILPEAIFVSTIRGAPPHEIDAMIASARELQGAPDVPPSLRANIDHSEAFALEYRGDLDGALAKYRSNAESLRKSPMPAAPYLLTQALDGIANLHMRRGEHWAAIPAYERVIESVQNQSADERGMFLADARSRQAEAALFIGDLDTAAKSSVEAVQGLSRYGGTPEHVAMELAQYGYILGIRGNLVEGRALIEDGIRRLRALDRGPMLPQLLHQLAHLRELGDEPELAARLVAELRGLLVDHGMSRPGHEASTWAWLATLHARAGQLGEAEAMLANAERDIAAMKSAIVDDTGAHDPRHVPDELLDRATAEVAAARGDWRTARESALLALADPSLHDGTPLSQGELGVVYWLLARALVHTGDREDALEVASLAEAAFATADPIRRRKRSAVASWRDEIEP